MQLADAFGLVIQCRDNAGEQALLAQTIHTLQQAVWPGKPLYRSCVDFSTKDYKEVSKHNLFLSEVHWPYVLNAVFQLVVLAQSLQVELSPGAQKMIHGYYMASRRVRSQTQGIKMSVASVKLL